MDTKKTVEEIQEKFKNAPKHADLFKQARRAGKPLLTHWQLEQQFAEERASRKPSKDYVRKTEHKRRIAELCKRSVAR